MLGVGNSQEARSNSDVFSFTSLCALSVYMLKIEHISIFEADFFPLFNLKCVKWIWGMDVKTCCKAFIGLMRHSHIISVSIMEM